MFKFLPKATLGIAAAVLASSAHALTIDNFTTPQTVLVDGTSGDAGVWSQIPGTGILGGYRDLFVTMLDAGGHPSPRSEIGVGAGRLFFDNTGGTVGVGMVRWDGPTVGTGATLVGAIESINPIGLQTGGVGVDLLAEGNHIKIVTNVADHGFPFTLQAFTNAGQWSQLILTATGVALGAPPSVSLIPLWAFAPIAGGGVDWTNVGALQAIINHPEDLEAVPPRERATAVDLQLSLVQVVPEPASIALVGMALLAAGVASRRRLG